MANTEILQKILGNDLCAKWINLRDYAFDKLSANADIKAIMDEVDKYGYGEWVCEDNVYQPKGNVPIMTSNTAPYGVASAYQVFDGNPSTTASGTNFSYQFTNPICVKDFVCKTNAGVDISGGTLQASNDGTTWVVPTAGAFYLYYRVHFASSKTVGTVQFYGREMKVSVPAMTSNTAPWGEAHASVETISNYPPKNAFDGQGGDGSSNVVHYWSDNTVETFVSPCFLQYTFPKPVKIKMVKTVSRWLNTCYLKDFTIYGSNDGGTTKEILHTVTGRTSTEYNVSYELDNEDEYTTYGIQMTSSNRGNMVVNVLNFFGFDYSERDWDTEHPMRYLYDHGVELEEMGSEGYGNNNPEPIKESEQLYFAPMNNATYRYYGVDNAINVTIYALIRIVTGNKIVKGDNSYGYIMIGSSKINTTNTAFSDAYKNLTDTSTFPYTTSLDIKNIIGDKYMNVNSGYNSRSFSVTELWLE